MRSLHIKRLLSVLFILSITPAHAERHALLVGISEYESPLVSDLEGPVHDIAALKKALIEHWEFPEKSIVTLVDSDATRPRVLEELGKLKDKTNPGDHIFFYFSGHGTSRRDEGHDIPLPHTSGALIPVDFPGDGSYEEQLEKIIIGKRDIRPLLTVLDEGERNIFVAIDSCYSGNAVRNVFGPIVPKGFRTKTRFVKMTPSAAPRGLTRTKRTLNMMDDPDLCGYRCGTKEIEPYPYRNVFFLSAASDAEIAEDISGANLRYLPTVDGKPHGAFSDALLRVLTGDLNADTNNDGSLIYDEIRRVIKDFMGNRQYSHTPQVLPQIQEDIKKLAQRQVFEYTKGIPFASAAAIDLENKPILRVQLVEHDDALKAILESIEGVELVDENPEIGIKRKGEDTLLISGAGDLIVRLQNNPSPEVLGQRIQQQLWIKKLLQAATGKAKFNITLDQLDSHRGVTAVEGDHVAFTVRSEKPAYLLLLVVDSKGAVSVLYPFDETELKPIPADQVIQIPPGGPDDIIEVTEPFGTDQLIIYGFEHMPPLLQDVMGQQQLTPGSDLLAKLENLLLDEDITFARESLQLITLPRQAPSL
jgi:hypothetical protein